MPRKKIKRAPRLSPQEKTLRREQRRFRAKIRSVFATAGFSHIQTRDEEFEFKGRKGEFDSLFLLENILVVAEDTCGTSETARTHLLKKSLFYQHLLQYKDAFIEYLWERFPDFSKVKKPEFGASDYKLIVAYCSKNRLEDQHKEPFKQIRFIEDRHLQYFSSLAKTLGQTMRFELFKFFGLKAEDIGLGAGQPSRAYEGFILPESPSGFPTGYKVVTFYVDPDTLMSLSYVLRKDGWLDGDGLYQRMISKSKIKSMRQYLAQDERVFINNVIVSLPSSTKVLDTNTKNQLDFNKINKTTPVTVEIPIRFNSIGVIDGQHRVFSYHEGHDSYESQIAPKRKKQQLLVTGVVYPEVLSDEAQRGFEAKLFLEINDKQTRTRADLRQAIEAIVNPFSVVAISRSVITRLAANGPLCGVLEEHQFDRGKLKSSSIVSYGLRHIVKCEGEDSLFKLWKNPEKEQFSEAVKAASMGRRRFKSPAKTVLDDYVQFCAKEINHVLIGYKIAVPKELWTLDRKQSRALSTTAVNGIIFCLRNLLEQGKTTDIEGYKAAFSKLTQDFSPKKFKYKSSHWKDLGLRIATECFL